MGRKMEAAADGGELAVSPALLSDYGDARPKNPVCREPALLSRCYDATRTESA